MNEELELEKRLEKVAEAKMAAIAKQNFELAANIRDEEKMLQKQLEELKKLNKD